MIELRHVYAFIGGAFVGRFGGLIPAIIVSVILLYVVDSSIFTSDTVIHSKEVIIGLVKNFTN